MSVISRVTTWSDGQVLTASALNGEFNNILNNYNGDITNANISASAAIATSKIAFPVAESSVTFSGSGHGHSGGTDGKIISKNVSYGGFISGTPSVANDLAINPRVRAASTATRISAYSRTAPTGADLILRVWNVTQGATVGSVTVTAGSNSATTTTITNATLTAGDILRFDVTQIGSTIAGSNITIQMDGTE